MEDIISWDFLTCLPKKRNVSFYPVDTLALSHHIFVSVVAARINVMIQSVKKRFQMNISKTSHNSPKQVKELYMQWTRAKLRALIRGETSSHRSTSRFSVLLPTLSKLMPSIPTQPPAEKIDFNYLPKWLQIPRVGNPCWSNLHNQNNSLGVTNETSTLTKRVVKVPLKKKKKTTRQAGCKSY